MPVARSCHDMQQSTVNLKNLHFRWHCGDQKGRLTVIFSTIYVPAGVSSISLSSPSKDSPIISLKALYEFCLYKGSLIPCSANPAHSRGINSTGIPVSLTFFSVRNKTISFCSGKNTFPTSPARISRKFSKLLCEITGISPSSR